MEILFNKIKIIGVYLQNNSTVDLVRLNVSGVTHNSKKLRHFFN